MTTAFEGRVIALFTAPSGGEPMESHDSIAALAGAGLAGDRYATETGTYSGTGRGPRDVTLIEEEAIDAAATEAEIDIPAIETRRNIVTQGVPLNHLVGQEFRVGSVLMRGYKLAEPCAYLERVTGRAVRAPLVHRGGLRAEILEAGEIHVGDPVLTT